MGHTSSKPNPVHLPPSLTTHPLPRRFSATHKTSLTRITALLSDPDNPSGPSYAVSWPAGWYGNMILHGGPTKDDEPLATAKFGGKLGCDFYITLPSLPESAQQQERTEILRYEGRLRSEKWWFAMQIGSSVERFEWRRSHGDAVKEVEGGSGWGWKLVRVVGEGEEVVAVWADAGLSLSRMGAFEYRGSGATGELGLLWGVMAVVTCMCVWQMRQQRNTTAAIVS
ncbi:hypothetical protein QBC34DRAFT_440971 [Podospora aff. communis PSN243]|uniref:Uncharacterized protein n=1 Tax=Podospora aff. communis PSN243 TaxID=3040156 RepID=A0AAV9GED3_9PEZI|nr:hypothetical protein QBC34DRAFT_440971 [Podospora aff. communis PSN243]